MKYFLAFSLVLLTSQNTWASKNVDDDINKDRLHRFQKVVNNKTSTDISRASQDIDTIHDCILSTFLRTEAAKKSGALEKYKEGNSSLNILFKARLIPVALITPHPDDINAYWESEYNEASHRLMEIINSKGNDAYKKSNLYHSCSLNRDMIESYIADYNFMMNE